MLSDKYFTVDQITDQTVYEYWEKAAETFAKCFARPGEEYYHSTMVQPTFFEMLGDLTGKSVLDLACGEGYTARALADRHKHRLQIHGIDFSPTLIRVARERNGGYEECIRLEVANAASLGYLPAASFDVVMCNMAIADIKPYKEAIREASRLLKPNGIFGLSMNHPCFDTPGGGWIRVDPASWDIDNNKGWRVDNYHRRIVCESSGKPTMKTTILYFHRTLSDYIAALRDAGFAVVDAREPVPTPEMIAKNPGLVLDLKSSGFLSLKCVKVKA